MSTKKSHTGIIRADLIKLNKNQVEILEWYLKDYFVSNAYGSRLEEMEDRFMKDLPLSDQDYAEDLRIDLCDTLKLDLDNLSYNEPEDEDNETLAQLAAGDAKAYQFTKYFLVDYDIPLVDPSVQVTQEELNSGYPALTYYGFMTVVCPEIKYTNEFKFLRERPSIDVSGFTLERKEYMQKFFDLIHTQRAAMFEYILSTSVKINGKLRYKKKCLLKRIFSSKSSRYSSLPNYEIWKEKDSFKKSYGGSGTKNYSNYYGNRAYYGNGSGGGGGGYGGGYACWNGGDYTCGSDYSGGGGDCSGGGDGGGGGGWFSFGGWWWKLIPSTWVEIQS
ncbi:hypothetical protein CANARDRAFT_88578 [[Candida] arabinofermentans NRRL YB-2248]|uniref:Uncharacterized protein n=1 Tax=[Candida] arabinofermentans NRRL YB-2248 TaxID=983967 RepID=A0A1E4T632_9ASCO|nr:hypothetical protein CANARDRAFT_88578 [[Candida] arabinofermentans NRRL YB-2248]